MQYAQGKRNFSDGSTCAMYVSHTVRAAQEQLAHTFYHGIARTRNQGKRVASKYIKGRVTFRDDELAGSS